MVSFFIVPRACGCVRIQRPVVTTCCHASELLAPPLTWMRGFCGDRVAVWFAPLGEWGPVGLRIDLAELGQHVGVEFPRVAEAGVQARPAPASPSPTRARRWR
jgi:hypothetical protein